MGGRVALEVIRRVPERVIALALLDTGYQALAPGDAGEREVAGRMALVEKARRHGMRATLVTNGTLLHQARRIDGLAEHVDLVMVELHGLAATHDAATGRQGSFAQTITNLALLRAAGIPFGMRLALTAANVAELEDVVELAAGHGAIAVDVRSSWDGGLDDDTIATVLAAARPQAGCSSVRSQSAAKLSTLLLASAVRSSGSRACRLSASVARSTFNCRK